MPIANLSIIVPTVNEEKNIGELLEQLRQQKNIQIEVIIADGGSTDNTFPVIQRFLDRGDIDIKLISTTTAGRGLQMNQGASVASAKDLLFLHADSGIEDKSQLKTAWMFLKKQQERLGHDRVAGHFALRFRRRNQSAPRVYYFYESKTYLNRLDTVNGDQGFMLSKAFLQSLEGFDQTLGYMEDARLARKIFASGHWVTLPGTITTSARRFESEGLTQRQTVNTLLRTFDHIGLPEFLTAADSYREQDKTGRLDLKPIFLQAHRVVAGKGLAQYTRIWYRIGAYVASNAWQLAFAWDCRRNFSRGFAPGHGSTPAMRFYDRWLAPVIVSPPGRLAAMMVAFIGFYSMLLILSLRR